MGLIFLCAFALAATQGLSAGVPIGGVRWATANVASKGKFADNAQDYGGFFTFDEAQKACPEGWRTPTVEEFIKLNNVAISFWTMRGEVNGRIFGTGNNHIFLPASGALHRNAVETGETPHNRGKYGGYWSSSLYSPNRGYLLGFYEHSAGPKGRGNVDYKYSVRCVRDE